MEQPGAPGSGAEERYRAVTGRPVPDQCSPRQWALVDFGFGDVWARPGLSRRDRRWIDLVTAAVVGERSQMEEDVAAAVSSGDVTVDELHELALHIAVYCGWPATRLFDQVLRDLPVHPHDAHDAGPRSDDDRSCGRRSPAWGSPEEAFAAVMQAPPPSRQWPFQGVGVLDFVFSRVWTRPGLGCRERRIVSLACSALCDAPKPLAAHVRAALVSGDLTVDEVGEFVLQFAIGNGFVKGGNVHYVVEQVVRSMEEEKHGPSAS